MRGQVNRLLQYFAATLSNRRVAVCRFPVPARSSQRGDVVSYKRTGRKWRRDGSPAGRFYEVNMNNPFEALLHSRKFWLAAFAVVQTVLFQFVPNFPQPVWMSIDALVAVLITTIAYEDAAASKAQAARLMRGNCDEVA